MVCLKSLASLVRTAITFIPHDHAHPKLESRGKLQLKRIIVLATLLTVGALSLAVTASQQPAAGGAATAAPRIVEVEKLRDNLFVLKGGGGPTLRSRRRSRRCSPACRSRNLRLDPP